MDLAAAQQVLKTTFGYDEFRPGQKAVIEQVLAGENTLAVMPTGGGKSLCYQIPALLFNGLTVVVSPLISLMKDQVDALNDNGIAATFINSSLDYQSIQQRLNELRAGDYTLLYIAPERLDSPQFIRDLGQLPIDLLAIDEAHCISQWGHDFRPSYLALSTAIEQLPTHPQVLALTATATEQVAQDICERLSIAPDDEVNTGFARDNLDLAVVKDQDTDRYILDYLKANQGEAGIIYASTRKEVARITTLLQHKQIKATMYHAGLDDEVRRQNQEDFLFDRVQVMVATNAFGMGIDKSNVRFVIHAQVPGTLEAYYQEAGRAGRDGLPSEAILMFRPNDIQLQHFFIDQSEMDDEHKHRAYQKLQVMTQYANTQGCLQQFILNYFGEKSAPCQRCSNCRDDREAQDITTNAQKVLSCVVRVHSRFGKGVIAQVLTGANNQRIRDLDLKGLPTYGIMADQRQKSVTELVDFLTAAGYLQSIGGQYPTLTVTKTGVGVLKGETKVYRKTAQTVKAAAPVNDALFEQLRTLRRQLAEDQQVPPFVIFSDKTLHSMCDLLPATDAEFLNVRGVGANKLDKYGETFMQTIRAYVNQPEATTVD
ncbi:DNA helicase RecQ [Lactiplantibacillus mudanjiangensis]|uniref:DNA helicase RecQ n=1 Tax=Lactiplantibacillus mudanjiangensis TaxID=1296538 RepID=A0A660E8K8_9LACO|nr:DNA helicase RecQ [Lactiplantibacillus mudanjiangensis]VDG17765.1 DNA helicase RecQ [Lactobacillus sp.] [Lactiplantibacillus mudanjiangensis]VDG26297.1 DNA helicase RecQ [Lactobacillus sp.] [Lactiplantibacillus mudanjiangensis]VDG29429.1 DNA helicase RecQ [Lactobacillus sp.] [Lactiplantibacillus mudanjiangensis]VDG32544.1 DNA helicase RecQ [Lactobacillus sp.] [Lactiplantibacillus mudanjiangensis]